MGFLSKAWKGIKKGFKKVGKAIKRGFKKFGKFMGRIGILGQIAMSFILPGIGGFLIEGLGSMLGLGGNITSLSGLAGNLAAKKGFMGALGKGLSAGLETVNAVTTPFRTITEGITTLGKTAINKVGNIFRRQTPIFSKGLSPAVKEGRFFGSDGALREVGRTLKPSSMVQSVRDFNKGLAATRTNAEALNVIKEANPDVFKDWSATSKGVFDPTMDKYRTITTPGRIEKDFRGIEHPYGATETLQQYEYTPISAGNVPGTPVYGDLEKYTNVPVGSIPTGATEAASATAPESLLSRATRKIRELPSDMIDATAQSVAALPGQMLTTSAYQAVGLTPTASDLTPDYGKPYSPPILAGDDRSFDLYQYNLATEQDPNAGMALAYQGEDNQARDWYDNNIFGGANIAWRNWMEGTTRA